MISCDLAPACGSYLLTIAGSHTFPKVWITIQSRVSQTQTHAIRKKISLSNPLPVDAEYKIKSYANPYPLEIVCRYNRCHFPERIERIHAYLTCSTIIVDTLPSQCQTLFVHLPDARDDDSDSLSLIFAGAKISDRFVDS